MRNEVTIAAHDTLPSLHNDKSKQELNAAGVSHERHIHKLKSPRCLLVCISNKSLWLPKLVEGLITSFRGEKKRKWSGDGSNGLFHNKVRKKN